MNECRPSMQEIDANGDVASSKPPPELPPRANRNANQEEDHIYEAPIKSSRNGSSPELPPPELPPRLNRPMPSEPLQESETSSSFEEDSNRGEEDEHVYEVPIKSSRNGASPNQPPTELPPRQNRPMLVEELEELESESCASIEFEEDDRSPTPIYENGELMKNKPSSSLSHSSRFDEQAEVPASLATTSSCNPEQGTSSSVLTLEKSLELDQHVFPAFPTSTSSFGQPQAISKPSDLLPEPDKPTFESEDAKSTGLPTPKSFEYLLEQADDSVFHGSGKIDVVLEHYQTPTSSTTLQILPQISVADLEKLSEIGASPSASILDFGQDLEQKSTSHHLAEIPSDPKNDRQNSDSMSSSRTSLASSNISSGMNMSQQAALANWGNIISTFAAQHRLGSAPLPRIKQWLKLTHFCVKLNNKLEEESQLSILVKLDQEEVYQTACAPCTSTCTFGDTITEEFKPNTNTIRFYLVEHLPGMRSRLVGRAVLKRKDVMKKHEQWVDFTCPIYGVVGSRSMVYAVILEMCLDISYDHETRIMTIRLLGYSIPPSASDQLKTPNGQFVLSFCVLGHGEFSTMKKLEISTKRCSLQTVQLDCGGSLAEKIQHTRQISVDSVTSECTTQSVHSLTLTPGTPCSIHRPTPTSSTGSTSTLFEENPLCLSVKVYKDEKYSSCVGGTMIPLEEATMLPRGNSHGPNWYDVKSKMTVSATSSTTEQKRSLSTSSSAYEARASTSTTTSLTKSSTSSARSTEKVGEIRLNVWRTIDEILPLVHYQPLYKILMNSLSMQPQSASLVSLLQCLSVDLENIAKPLMRIYLHSNQFRAFFRNICSQYISSCYDVNTLFRSQSITSKVTHEFMMFVGRQYLEDSLKPLIQLICVERKCCEIDPSKLKPGDSLEQNMRNLMIYAELAFGQVVGSRSRCPQVLREVFADLRDVVSQFYPSRIEVTRQALSSFLIMRFFAPAILNPKIFDRTRQPPNGDVQRTLVLISKILQRLANCVVSTHPLTQKEEWLTPVLSRFSDERHRNKMIEFLDSVSAPGVDSPLLSKDHLVLKEGIMVEKRSPTEKRLSIKNLMNPRRRHVVLTENDLSWQKIKESSGDAEPLGSIMLDDITNVSPLSEAKNSFSVKTHSNEVHFQATNSSEMNEWLILIQKQRHRHKMVSNRSSANVSEPLEVADIKIESELESIHTILVENNEKLKKWLAALNSYEKNAPQFPDDLLKLFKNNDDEILFTERLQSTIEQALNSTDEIENAHQTAIFLVDRLKNFPKGTNIPLDNENYLLMKSANRKRPKQSN